MKKLLVISLLLLALVFTVVACTGDTGDTTDTTAAETAGATEEPTAAPTDADEETTIAEEPTESPAPEETTEAPVEDPTKAPETTEKPQVTEEPEKPTEPPVTEPVDPMAPISMFDADALNSNTASAGGIESFERIENFLRIDPSNNDPKYYPFANVAGGRFIAIKYRTPNADGTTVQLYIGSTGTGPTDDTSMLCVPTIADGEWHVALFDTQSLIDAGIYDGSTVSYFRFDALECDYIRDENGEPQEDPVAGWLRYPMPEGAYVDVQYVGFFNSADAAALYDCQPDYIATAEDLAGMATNTTNVTLNDGYVTLTGTGGDGWIMALNAGTVADLNSYIVALRYRTTLQASGEFFAGSGGSATGGSEKFFDYNFDGEWHTLYVDVSDLSDMSGALNYIRYDYYPNATDNTIDVAYIAVFNTLAQAEAYDAIVNKLPEDTHNFKSDIASQSGDFKASDVVTNLFVENPGAGNGSWFDVTGAAGYGVTNLTEIKADENGVGTAYHLANYNEMLVKPDGTYAYSATIVDNADPNRNFLFVRGVRAFNFGDQGYFGHDGNNSYAGCGGIYAMVKDGVLVITIRSYTDGACVRNIYTAEVDSNKITFADNGETVYILAGDTLIATVEISGKRDFGYAGVGADECAAKVVLTMAGGEPVEIADAVVAATHLSDIGMAIREHNNYITFSELSLTGFSTVTIPELPEPPEYLTSDKADYLVGEPIMITAIGEGKDWVGIANRGATESIGWYYVEAVAGQAVNFFENAQAGDGSALTSLPAGDYTIYLIPNDENLATATPIAVKDISIFDPIELNYVTDGLVSCYSGQGYSNTVWTDLVGDNDLEFKANDDNYVTDTGLHVLNGKHSFNKNIVNLVNGNTFTVEILLGDFVSVGESFNTFMNSTNDNFALFRRCATNQLEFKFAANPGDQRPKIDNGLELIDNSLITVTYTVGGNCRIYVDGVMVSENPAPSAMGADDLFIGHNQAAKLFETTYKSIRLYDRELTAAEVLANAQTDGVAQ